LFSPLELNTEVPLAEVLFGLELRPTSPEVNEDGNEFRSPMISRKTISGISTI
jgi:hypothetical protein